MHVISVQFPVLEAQLQLSVLTIHFSFVQPFWFTQVFVQDVLQPVFVQPVLLSPPRFLPFPMSPMSLGKTYSKVFFLSFSSFRIFLLLFLQIYKTFYIIIRKRVKKFHGFCNYFYIIFSSL